MALLHRATLTPSKLDLLSGALGRGLTAIGSYRFDDPSGQVGIESHVVTDGGGAVLHLPLTYRAEPLAGAEEWALGTIEHSVLGTRWVYNGCGDPAYASELLRTILTGATQVEQYFETTNGREYREPTVTVKGTGEPGTPVPQVHGVHAEAFDTATVIDAGGHQVVVRHDVGAAEPESTSGRLEAMWADLDQSVTVAFLP